MPAGARRRSRRQRGWPAREHNSSHTSARQLQAHVRQPPDCHITGSLVKLRGYDSSSAQDEASAATKNHLTRPLHGSQVYDDAVARAQKPAHANWERIVRDVAELSDGELNELRAICGQERASGRLVLPATRTQCCTGDDTAAERVV